MFSRQLYSLFLCFIALQLTAQEAKVYLIKWQPNPNLYITEEGNGQLVVSARDNTQRQFWRFVPVAGKSQVYYLQNTATRRYIQSTKRPASSQSKVFTGEQPVPFYVAQNPQATVKGGWSMVSTDVPHYDQPGQNPIGLNKDGGSQNVICYTAGHTNKGSYWLLQESADLYEVHPFGVGKSYRHLIVSEHEALEELPDGTLRWGPIAHTQPQMWYFVGESNAAGGYSIVNAKSGRAIAGGKHFPVAEELPQNEYESSHYYFRLSNGEKLSIAGRELLRFPVARSPIALRGRLYDQPCGKKVGAHIARLNIEGENVLTPLRFPEPGKTATDHYYTLFTRSQAVVVRGSTIRLSLQLNTTPHPQMQAWAYFDWNADGIFEQAQALHPARNMTELIDIPTHAKLTQTRMRIRLTMNRQAGADDDVMGYVWDGLLHLSEAPTALSTPRSTSSPQQGIYNLLGQPLVQPTEGINIIDGQKTLLK